LKKLPPLDPPAKTFNWVLLLTLFQFFR
jgi:hypothetical protein